MLAGINRRAYQPSSLQALDASGNCVNILGCLTCDLQVSVKVNGRQKPLQIRGIKFYVVESLSVEAIMGVGVIKFLASILLRDEVRLNEKLIEIQPKVRKQLSHILSITSWSSVLKFRLEEFINLIDDSGSGCSIIRLVLTPCQLATMAPGLYGVRLDLSNFQLVKEQNVFFLYVPPPSGEDRGGSELQARSVDLTFGNMIEELPTVIHGTCWKLENDRKTIQTESLICKLSIAESELTDEMIDVMMKDTVLSRRKLKKLIRHYETVFSCGETDLGTYSRPVKIEIADPTGSPSYAKPRVIPYQLREWVDKKLAEMCKQGLIQLSEGSPFNSPVHLVKKKEPGSYRITIDYRQLNSKLVQNRWPIPHVRELLQSMGGAKFFTIFDLKSGFWQLQLTPESRELTAFSVRGHQYCWRVLPMGLSTAPAIFQKIMVSIFEGMLYKNVLVYIDDIICYNPTEKEHFETITEVFRRLKKAGIRLHPGKSLVGQKEVEFLGYEIGAFGFRPI